MAESKIDRQDIEYEPFFVDTDSEETDDATITQTPKMSPTFDFKEKSWKTDCTLIVEGTKFHVAKNILALASPVFERMFESDLKKTTSEELELVGKRAEYVNEFLLAIYPRAPHVLSKEKALNVLPIAEEYQVLYLKQQCEDALLGSTDTATTTDELYRLIGIAHKYDLKTLLAKCVNFVSERSTEDIERVNKTIVLSATAEPLRDIFQHVLKRLKDLEISDWHKTQELDTNTTLMHFMLRTLKRADVLEFDGDLEWMGKTLLFTLDVKEKKPVTETVVLWGTELQIEIELLSKNDKEMFIASIMNVENKIDCYLKVQFVVFQKDRGEKIFSQLHETAFSSQKQTVQCDVAQLIQQIETEHNRFRDGKVQIELNILMSNPKMFD